LQPSARDLALYGRVKATLDTGTVKLSAPDKPAMTWEFDLQTAPLGAAAQSGSAQCGRTGAHADHRERSTAREITVQLPDLADPGYVGSVRPLVDGMHFRYGGLVAGAKDHRGHHAESGGQPGGRAMKPELRAGRGAGRSNCS